MIANVILFENNCSQTTIARNENDRKQQTIEKIVTYQYQLCFPNLKIIDILILIDQCNF